MNWLLRQANEPWLHFEKLTSQLVFQFDLTLPPQIPFLEKRPLLMDNYSKNDEQTTLNETKGVSMDR